MERRRVLGLSVAGLAAIGLRACEKRHISPVNKTDAFIDYDAMGLAALLREKQITATELVDATLNRITRLEPHINALTHREFEHARQRAGKPLSSESFSGVPFLYKDLIDVAGRPRSSGAHEAFSYTPAKSPTYMQAVERSGLNILGATNTPEFATSVNTSNLRFGATKNPWNLKKSVAGSSGGSAATVAAGYVPMAHGTDGSGSLRLPASYCGIFALKPSRGRTVSGEANGGHDVIKHNHVLTRSVRDSAMMLAVTEDNSAAAPYSAIGFVKTPLKRRLRIGLDRGGMFNLTPDILQQQALHHTLQLLNSLGHDIIELPPFPISGEEFWTHMEAVFLARMPALKALVERITQNPFAENELLSTLTASFVMRVSDTPAQDFNAAKMFFANLTAELEEWQSTVDVILSPVQPVAQFDLDTYGPEQPYEGVGPSMQAFMSYTAHANATGAPAMSVPLFWSDTGLPLGSHFQALPGQDKLLFELAYELEQAAPWADKWAPYSAKYFG